MPIPASWYKASSEPRNVLAIERFNNHAAAHHSRAKHRLSSSWPLILRAMRVLLSVLGVLTLLSVAPLARGFLEGQECSSEYYHCRMECDTTEYAIRYCEDWTICCRAKSREAKKKRLW